MENDKKHKEVYDPYGLVEIVGFVGVGLTAVQAIVQFAPLLNRKKARVLKEFRRLRKAVIQAQIQLDSLVMLFHRYEASQHLDKEQHEGKDSLGTLRSISSLTLVETRMIMKSERDYHHLTAIQAAMDMVRSDLADIMHTLREFDLELNDHFETLQELELVQRFDELFLNLSTYTIGEYIEILRKCLEELSDKLSKLINAKG
jgi:predicted DNA-binding ArsR family transcriptional regulator